MRKHDGFNIGQVGPLLHVDRADGVDHDNSVGAGGSDSDDKGVTVVPGKEIISVTSISLNRDITSQSLAESIHRCLGRFLCNYPSPEAALMKTRHLALAVAAIDVTAELTVS